MPHRSRIEGGALAGRRGGEKRERKERAKKKKKHRAIRGLACDGRKFFLFFAMAVSARSFTSSHAFSFFIAPLLIMLRARRFWRVGIGREHPKSRSRSVGFCIVLSLTRKKNIEGPKKKIQSQNNVVAIAAAPAGLALAGLLSAPPQRLPHGDGVPLLRIGCTGEFLDRGGGHAGAGVGAPQKTRQRKSAATPPTASRV